MSTLTARHARIPKGTTITGTFPERTKTAGRTYTVTLHDIDEGYAGHCYCRTDGSNEFETTPPSGSAPWPAALADGHGKHCYHPRLAQVCWVGTGGYWHYANVADVELVEGTTR